MRVIAAAIAFLTSFGWAQAFEIEDQKFYGFEDSKDVVKIISTSDIEIFEPLLLAFVNKYPSVGVDYTVASSQQVFKAVYDEQAEFDLVISSAMDLQMKIANDNLARQHISEATQRLPEGAKWRDRVFAFTYETAVFLISRSAFHQSEVPLSRRALVELVRQNTDRFSGRIGTYDIRISGLGYLLATQDSLSSQTYWRLTEVFGLAGTRLYCCSADMIRDVEQGRLAFAYNVLDSYALRKVAEGKPNVQIVEFSDFQTSIMRTALIPKNVKNEEAAEAMLDFLVTLADRPNLALSTGMNPIIEGEPKSKKLLSSVTLGPSLLVFLDSMKRSDFVNSWVSSMRIWQESN
ncbi:ABC transporter substrate-binding protein [Ruegeria lacuscaerulensis]|uniref:ABC transporter substrate-binding protein n=1 Tax=Ruegeria lacuscaerulensis TaxID=55218 RepID=UPI003013F3D2